MEKEWIPVMEIDFQSSNYIRIDTRDFKAFSVKDVEMQSKDQLIKEGLSEENFIKDRELMGFISGLKRRNSEKPIWIENSKIKYIALEKCLDDHWLVMDRNGDPIEWRKI